jgi:hypothetical protein
VTEGEADQSQDTRDWSAEEAEALRLQREREARLAEEQRNRE